jgi:hypothetical protein
MKIICDKNNPEKIVIDISTDPEESDDLRFKNIVIMSDYEDLDEFKNKIINEYRENKRKEREERFENISQEKFGEVQGQISELINIIQEELKLENFQELFDYADFLIRKETYRQILDSMNKNIKIKKK